jgi:uncharacterized membrane protein YccC
MRTEGHERGARALVLLSLALVAAIVAAAIVTMIFDDNCPQLAKSFVAVCSPETPAPEP